MTATQKDARQYAAAQDKLIEPFVPAMQFIGITANGLTKSRIWMTPLIVALFWYGVTLHMLGITPEVHTWALDLAIAIVVAGWVTEFADGPFARLTNTVSTWGKIWDPNADKYLVYACLFSVFGVIDLYAVGLLLALDITSTLFRRYGIGPLGAIPAGKWKTVVIAIASFGYLIVVRWQWDALIPVCHGLTWLAVLLAGISIEEKLRLHFKPINN